MRNEVLIFLHFFSIKTSYNYAVSAPHIKSIAFSKYVVAIDYLFLPIIIPFLWILRVHSVLIM